MYIDFIRRCHDYKSGFKEVSESDSWLTCSINGSYYLSLFFDNRKCNVNSFIGHLVVLQYVIFRRVEQI